VVAVIVSGAVSEVLCCPVAITLALSETPALDHNILYSRNTLFIRWVVAAGIAERIQNGVDTSVSNMLRRQSGEGTCQVRISAGARNGVGPSQLWFGAVLTLFMAGDSP